jgi:hypothetical protein
MPMVSSFVQLRAAERVAHPLELPRLVGAFPEVRPRPQQLQREPDDEVADGKDIGVRGVDDLDPAGAAGGHVDVLDAHPAPADDPEVRGAGRQGGVRLRVGADHQPGRVRQRGVELGGPRGRLDDPGALLQSRQRRRGGVFGDQDERQFGHAARYCGTGPPEIDRTGQRGRRRPLISVRGCYQQRHSFGATPTAVRREVPVAGSGPRECCSPPPRPS